MIGTFLQTLTAEDIQSKADSTKAEFTQFAETLIEDPQTALHTLAQDAIDFGVKVLAALAIYIIGAWIIRRVKRWLKKVFARRNTDKTIASFTSSLVSITLTIILIILTISTLGVNTTSLAALLASGGLAIGMALSGTMQNFAGGIMILAFKPFKAGDYIEAQGYSGTVTSVSIVSTKLTTIDNRVIIIPNGTLFNGNINNYSNNAVRRVDWEFGVEYGTDADKCKTALLAILNADERVLKAGFTPETADPVVVISSLADNAVKFTVKAWVKSENYWDLLYDVNAKVYDALPKEGIAFAYPQLDVHLHSTSASTPATARKQ